MKSQVEISRLSIVIVTFNPDLQLLSRIISVLPQESALVLVDNFSRSEFTMKLIELTKKHKRFSIILNNSNFGLATALNQGIKESIRLWSDTLFLLLLDQDSEPRIGSIEILMSSCQGLIVKHKKFGCVGPNLIDPHTGISHGFHRIQNFCWTRKYLNINELEPLACHNLNGSGTLMPTFMYKTLGGMDESLFIDHVDTEWSFRVLAAGGFLYGIPNAVFDHRMGDSCKRYWVGRWRTFPIRSPLRHYYLFRNAVKLMHRQYIPFTWKFWATIKLIITFFLHILFDGRRFSQAMAMIKGVCESLSPNNFKNQKSK